MEKKLRAAVIGAGWFAAQSHIPTLASRPEVILDSVCRLGKDELERVRSHFGFEFASEDAEEVLGRNPDIVVVATPHQHHYRWTKRALLGGAHVLCEKPMTLDPKEAWELVEIAQRQGLSLLIANSHNYLPYVDDLRARIKAGLIGDIEHIMSSMVSVTRDVFLGDRGLDSWKTTFFRPERSTWQDPAQGGGFAYGQLSHSLALMFFLTDLKPVSISAASFLGGSVDLANAGTMMMENGAVASISGAAAMPQGGRALMRLVVAGSRGVVTADFDRDSCEIRLDDGTVERLPLAPEDWRPNAARTVHALVDLALGEGRNCSPGSIGAVTTASIAALLESSAAGGVPIKVQVEDALWGY